MKSLLTILTLLVSTISYGQLYSIYGKVSSGNEGLPGAVVLIENQNLNTETDESGRYTLNGLKPGKYDVTVFAYGFETSLQTVEITKDKVELDFEIAELQENLKEVVVSAEETSTFGVSRLKAVEGVTINEAKKTEVINIDNLVANKGANTARQVYSRIPGLNIWESDGAGVQLGIGGRGLSPNRSANFNVRQNGYDIAADALGYPESYYTPPVQAVKRIQIIRGAASLQYGTQFGGMVNFQLKEGSQTETFDFQSNQTVGSFGLFNSFNSFGGTIGKVNYYAFYDYKRSDGWRPNSSLNQHTAYAAFKYNFNTYSSMKLEYTFMDYLAQQPGGLTDNEFLQDPRQSNRTRNWFQVNWNLLAATFDHRFNSKIKLNSRFFALIATKDALGNLGRIDRPDDLDAERDLLKDEFNNWGNETRLIFNYNLLGKSSVLLVGGRYYQGFTHRMQGNADSSADPNFDYLNPENLEGSDFDLPSRNTSFFIENIFNVSDKVSITPGIRYEHILTESEGYFRDTRTDLAGNIIFDERIDEDKRNSRDFVFGGVGVSYKPNKSLEIYGNFSQNYRAINFNDIRVNNPSLEVDENLEDERGFNMDIGMRGQIGTKMQYDVSAFYLSYDQRIGTILQTEPDPRFNNLVDRTFRYRTNIADAGIYGLELFSEFNVLEYFNYDGRDRLNVFFNLGVIKSKYLRSEEQSVEGNEVELVPPVNFKSGLTYKRGNFGASLQFSHVHEHYSDASNAERTPNAVEGIIPSYHVVDLSLKYKYRNYQLQLGSNNLTDERYFTRRAAGYPGPGIIPSDGRSFYFTVGLDF